MQRLLWGLPVLCGLIVSATASAGQFNQVLEIGDKGPAWKELPGVDDKRHSLSDLKEAEIVVVVFTCNSCPYAADYEDRLIAAAKAFSSKTAGQPARVEFVAINVNTVEEDRLPQMKERAKEKKFPYPYLYDESQQIAKKYGANWTPEVFVLDKERKVVYMGGIDDNSDADKVTEEYLVPAIRAAVEGKAPKVAESAPRGCAIRFARERRREPF